VAVVVVALRASRLSASLKVRCLPIPAGLEALGQDRQQPTARLVVLQPRRSLADLSSVPVVVVRVFPTARLVLLAWPLVATLTIMAGLAARQMSRGPLELMAALAGLPAALQAAVVVVPVASLTPYLDTLAAQVHPATMAAALLPVPPLAAAVVALATAQAQAVAVLVACVSSFGRLSSDPL
jgi:hypothetical protein